MARYRVTWCLDIRTKRWADNGGASLSGGRLTGPYCIYFFNDFFFNYRLTAEKEELEREKDRLATQKLDTEEASQKRHEEHERLVADHRALLEELSQAKSAKCEALIQIQVKNFQSLLNTSAESMPLIFLLLKYKKVPGAYEYLNPKLIKHKSFCHMVRSCLLNRQFWPFWLILQLDKAFLD